MQSPALSMRMIRLKLLWPTWWNMQSPIELEPKKPKFVMFYLKNN